VIVVAVVILLNVIINVAARFVDLNADMTASDFYEISQESVDYIKELTAPVNIAVMTDEETLVNSAGTYGKQFVEIFKKYPINSDKITLEFVNLTLDPNYITKYDSIYSGEITSESIIVSSGNRLKVVALSDLVVIETDQTTYQQSISGSQAEKVITSAIMYVTDLHPKRAYLADVDMAEAASIQNIEVLLSENGYDVFTWTITEDIPADCDLLIVDAPLIDFEEAVIDRIYTFMENGGNYGKNMVYLANSAQKDTTNIKNYIREWGLELRTDSFVGESDTANIINPLSEYYFKVPITANDYTTNLPNPNLPVAVYYSSPIEILYANMSNVLTADLLQTPPTTFALTPELDENGQLLANSAITEGSYSLMAMGTKYMFNDDNQRIVSNLLVIGGSEMLDGSLTGSTYYNNAEYFLSVVNTMTGKGSGINVVAKNNDAATIEMTLERYENANRIFVFALPIAIVVCGGVVLLLRRHK
jgi:hypothetical protein